MTLAAVAAAAAVWMLAPHAQDPAYHQFADGRALFGIPNFWNVASNLLFLPAAWLAWCRGGERGMAVAAAAAGIAAGSAVYHRVPCDGTLYWDRLPMTLAFMGVVTEAIAQRVSERAARVLFAPLVVAGAASVELWRQSGDLRAYALVQFVPMAVLPLVLVFYSGRVRGWWTMLGLYAGAKILEHFDAAIWTALGETVSGHTLKHAAAALALIVFAKSVLSARRVLYNGLTPL